MSDSCDKWIYTNVRSCTPSLFFIAVAIVTFFGIVHNALLLTVAYRIKWFRYSQFFLIIFQSIVDLLMSIAWTINSARILSSTNGQMISAFNCVLTNLAPNILFTLSQRCALAVAFDRLLSLLFPFRWMRLTDSYRFALIAVGVFGATLQETCWLYFASAGKDTCTVPESQCYRLPQGGLKKGDNLNFSFFIGRISDLTSSILIVCFYIVLPCLSATLCKRVICGQENVQVYCNNMEQQQRRILVRVRLMSLATVGTYMCTTCIGLIFLDCLVSSNSDLYTIFMALSLLNTVPPLYLFAWKDEAFRCELKQILGLIFSFCGLSVKKEDKQHEQNDAIEVNKF